MTRREFYLRAIGPSLASFGVTDPLPDPILELHAEDGTLITTNDNWKDSPESWTSRRRVWLLPTTWSLPSSATLDPGLYTAVVNGKNGATGVGLVEAYDLDLSATIRSLATSAPAGLSGPAPMS